MPEVSHNGERIAEVNKTRNGDWINKQFSVSALLFWIKGRISVDYRGIHIVEPNTILGVFPAGQQRKNIPLKNVSDAEISTSYKLSRFLMGIILVIIGLVMFKSQFLVGLILVVLGAFVFMNGILTYLTIEHGGNPYNLFVPFFNKQDILDVKQAIDEALNTDTDKTDQSLYNHRLNSNDMDNIR